MIINNKLYYIFMFLGINTINKCLCVDTIIETDDSGSYNYIYDGVDTDDALDDDLDDIFYLDDQDSDYKGEVEGDVIIEEIPLDEDNGANGAWSVVIDHEANPSEGEQINSEAVVSQVDGSDDSIPVISQTHWVSEQ